MKNKLFVIGIILSCGFFISNIAHACSPAAQSLVDEGKASYSRRLNLPDAQHSLESFDKAVAADAVCLEALIGGSRAAWWVADHATNREEKIKIFQKGMDWGKAAVSLMPNSADAHFWLAGNMGSYGEARGVLKSLFLVKPIRRELEEIIKIDPMYDHGSAYRVLGVVDYKVPGLAGGSKSRALQNLSKALVMGPDIGFNRYYFAEYYATVGEKSKALEQLGILKNLAASDDQKPELLLMQEKGRVLESRLKGKNS